jgi:translation initiation factor eIF-2B subunit delta
MQSHERPTDDSDRSSVVEGILLSAKQQKRDFRVIVVDARPMLEGRHLLASLCAAGIPTTYVLLPALGAALRTVDLVLLGAHALLSDGAMYARAGTATVAMLAHQAGLPVACCCETYKFSDRVMLDSIVGNEVAPLAARPSEDEAEAGIKASAHLTPLDLLYDVSRPEDLTVVISEAGLVPPRSVPVVLREFKPCVRSVFAGDPSNATHRITASEAG